MDRIYHNIVAEHLKEHRQMIFLAGPRQVGKTTCAKSFQAGRSKSYYLNWETSAHRRLIIQGATAVAEYCHLDDLSDERPLIIFDEIHKYRKWKLFLKGFFDLYEDNCQVIVTGSAKLDIYRKGGDSLMGRYFPYRMHPLSTGELLNTEVKKTKISPPQNLQPEVFEQLLLRGGFPEPFSKNSLRFSNNWQRLRKQQLLKEDIRDLSQIQDLADLEFLVDLLEDEASQQLNIASIANHINVAESTLHRWVKVLRQFYYCYLVKPWCKNVRQAIRKTPKVYLWDWSVIKDSGSRAENFVASHLLKAVHYWTDIGLGEYELFYVRDKLKREVDILVSKNKRPWFLVEVKETRNKGISKALHYYHHELKTEHAFQVVLDMPYVEADCFQHTNPVIVPASTFLSQLV